MGKFKRTEYGMQNPCYRLDNTKVSTGGFVVDQANLVGLSGIIRRGALMEASYTTGVAKILKTALVVAGGTTSAPRVAKNHIFAVGEFVAKTIGGTAVIINAIDSSNADYDVLTLSGAITGLVADDVLFQAAAAGASAAYYATPNMLSYNDIDLDSCDATGVIMSLEIQEENLPYPLSTPLKTLLGSLFTFVKFN